jgi:membrane-bound lytic murein transglycosylase B
MTSNSRFQQQTFYLGIAISALLTITSCSNSPEHEKSPVAVKKESPKEITPPAAEPILKPIVSEPARATPLSINENTKNFIRKMVALHHFNEQELTQLLKSAVIKDDILKRIAAPSEGLPWHKYRKIFLTDARIEGGVKFWHENLDALNRVSQETGVPAEIIVAIIGVETGYGKNMGNHRVLDALATLAFAYPPRSAFFTSELEQFLLLCQDEKLNPRDPLGSYAGAMGYPQFMPSSFRALAKDFDHDTHRDIWHNPRDAIASVANYFVRNNWQRGQAIAVPATAQGIEYKSMLNKNLKPETTIERLSKLGVTPTETVSTNTIVKLLAFEQLEGEDLWLGFTNFYVITRYNHSPLYALAAYQLSQEIKQRKTL